VGARTGLSHTTAATRTSRRRRRSSIIIARNAEQTGEWCTVDALNQCLTSFLTLRREKREEEEEEAFFVGVGESKPQVSFLLAWH
jgi:hypothetical protein